MENGNISVMIFPAQLTMFFRGFVPSNGAVKDFLHKVQERELASSALAVRDETRALRPAQSRHAAHLVHHLVPSELRALDQGEYDGFFLANQRGSNGRQREDVARRDVVVFGGGSVAGAGPSILGGRRHGVSGRILCVGVTLELGEDG
eukprot:CCRYP_002773-RD/>CCRYP_002773-RD protein AED:0.16 eAED:0.22 QI:4190/0.66/0.75/1/0.66/0.5/4/0/147